MESNNSRSSAEDKTDKGEPLIKTPSSVDGSPHCLNNEGDSLFNSCPLCYCKSIHRDGTRLTSLGNKQRWLCNSCKHRFVLDPIQKIKGNLEAVTMCMDLYFKGCSYRSIQDTLKQ